MVNINENVSYVTHPISCHSLGLVHFSCSFCYFLFNLFYLFHMVCYIFRRMMMLLLFCMKKLHYYDLFLFLHLNCLFHKTYHKNSEFLWKEQQSDNFTFFLFHKNQIYKQTVFSICYFF